MQSGTGNLFTRDDTFFGVCEGLGEDLHIPSNLLRMGFALGFFFGAMSALMAYFALGILVLISRLLFPNPRAAKPINLAPAAALTAAQPVRGVAQSGEQMDLDRLPIAA